MKKVIIGLIILLPTIGIMGQTVNFKEINASSPGSKVFNVKDFGAVGDSLSMDTRAIQSAIDACNEQGGGIVRVPAGNYPIGTIILKSNVTLSLDHEAVLLGSQDITDYATD